MAGERRMTGRESAGVGRDVVAIILAIGAATALCLVTAAVMYDAVRNGDQLSENATQVVSGAFGALFGVLGTYLGVRVGDKRQELELAEKHAELESRRLDGQQSSRTTTADPSNTDPSVA